MSKRFSKYDCLIAGYFSADSQGTLQFGCNKCSLEFLSTISYADHEDETHDVNSPENRKYLCEICKKTWRQSAELISHVESLHNSPRCLYCHREFETKGARLSHEIAVHRNLMEYKCFMCTESYRSKKQLLAHELEKHFASAWVRVNIL